VLALGRAAALPHPIDLSACFTFLFMERDLASLSVGLLLGLCYCFPVILFIISKLCTFTVAT
jgi:hypothetical protein